MSKLTMLAAMLAMVLVVAVPATAQSLSPSNSGDFAMQCTPANQISNEGDVEENTPTFEQQGNSKADDFEAGGVTLAFEPGVEAECPLTIQQSSTAVGGR